MLTRKTDYVQIEVPIVSQLGTVTSPKTNDLLQGSEKKFSKFSTIEVLHRGQYLKLALKRLLHDGNTLKADLYTY